MFRHLFSAIALICCGVLIPINVTYNLAHVDASARDVLSMLTIRDVSGNVLFAHVAASYMVTFLVMFFVHVNWSKMVELRRGWFTSPEYMQSFYARTLQILHVPKKLQSDEGITTIFESVQVGTLSFFSLSFLCSLDHKVPYPTTSVHINRRVGKLPELIEYHNTTVRELEQVLVSYLKGGKIAKERPTVRIGGWLGMGGNKMDAIDFYT